MGNNVGRPTNASVRNKKVLKFISVFVILLGVFLLGYYSNNKVAHKKKCDEACPTTNENKVEFAFMLLMDEIYDGNNQTKKFTYDNKEYTLVNETDEEENKKILSAIQHGFIALLCIGETAEEKENGISEEILSQQLKIGLHGTTVDDCRQIWVAYEPVWSIGVNGTPATADYAEKMHEVIKDCLQEFGA